MTFDQVFLVVKVDRAGLLCRRQKSQAVYRIFLAVQGVGLVRVANTLEGVEGVDELALLAALGPR